MREKWCGRSSGCHLRVCGPVLHDLLCSRCPECEAQSPAETRDLRWANTFVCHRSGAGAHMRVPRARRDPGAWVYNAIRRTDSHHHLLTDVLGVHARCLLLDCENARCSGHPKRAAQVLEVAVRHHERPRRDYHLERVLRHSGYLVDSYDLYRHDASHHYLRLADSQGSLEDASRGFPVRRDHGTSDGHGPAVAGARTLGTHPGHTVDRSDFSRPGWKRDSGWR
mmetsp:Transcript_16025/g.25382  ORF Transcript_16025/g.25382 Transcript_16025/m.25382 type:complete len:224 (+) Transcript_16025:1010-1681(+)